MPLFSGFTNLDLIQYPLDKPSDLRANNPRLPFVVSLLCTRKSREHRQMTSLGHLESWAMMAFGGTRSVPVGMPEIVADEFER
jgi:hypothetical protein